MEMTESEALKIVREQEIELANSKRMNTQTVAREYAYIEAKGFLAGVAYERKRAEGLVKALEYCAVGPLSLRPENNRQCAVAMNAIGAYRNGSEQSEHRASGSGEEGANDGQELRGLK